MDSKPRGQWQSYFDGYRMARYHSGRLSSLGAQVCWQRQSVGAHVVILSEPPDIVNGHVADRAIEDAHIAESSLHVGSRHLLFDDSLVADSSQYADIYGKTPPVDIAYRPQCIKGLHRGQLAYLSETGIFE